MITRQRMFKGLCITGVGVIGSLSQQAHAQDAVLWRVQSLVSESAAPKYMGQSSPFPYVAPVAPVTKAEGPKLSDADIERLKQRTNLLEKLEELRRTGQALIPDTRTVRAIARIEGPAGPKVLVNNQWIGMNDKLKVPQKLSPAAQDLLIQLQPVDDAEAAQQKTQLMQKVEETGGAILRTQEISNTFIVLYNESKKSQLIVVPLAISR